MNNLDLAQYEAPPAHLRDRVILITGAGRGIGRAVAKAVAAQGATAVILGRKVPALEALYDEIVAAGDPEPAIYPMDLLGAGPGDYEQMADTIAEQLGRLDGLVLNAGMLGTLGALAHSDPDEFTRVMQVNVTACYLACRACVPIMNTKNDASIIFTSAAVGRRARAYWGAYAISKFAVEGMAQVLADELENTPIRINVLNPGATQTAMRSTAYPAENPNNLLTPEAITPAYLYLLGADSEAVRGQSLNAQNA
jgi:NAD(P)-dependent dehydrogenase (short-subunit alcohol dehydrogenase family)